MSLTLRAGTLALAPFMSTGFAAQGGVEPYSYSVVPGGAGGSINSASGVYTAPGGFSSDPKKAFDTVVATDSSPTPQTASAQVLVASPLLLLCDIIQKEMNLPNRVWLWDQKIFQPKDNELYIIVSVLNAYPFANTNAFEDGVEVQSVNMKATIGIDLISRGPAARDRKEELILALESNYARRQQDTNSFYVAKLPVSFVNLSELDGSAIPYRFHIDVNMQYFFRKSKATEFYSEFEQPEVTTED